MLSKTIGNLPLTNCSLKIIYQISLTRLDKALKTNEEEIVYLYI
jgi:hypothetical protein